MKITLLIKSNDASVCQKLFIIARKEIVFLVKNNKIKTVHQNFVISLYLENLPLKDLLISFRFCNALKLQVCHVINFFIKFSFLFT